LVPNLAILSPFPCSSVFAYLVLCLLTISLNVFLSSLYVMAL
jgi:hypothetical protein